MPRGTIEDAALEAEIGRLPALSLLELRNRWKTLFGHSAPKSLRRNFLARAVAYQIQVEAYGGLSVAIKRRLREIADAVRNGDANAALGSNRIKPGTQMIRQWQNTTHKVTALNEGFEWDGGPISRSLQLPTLSPAPTGTDMPFSALNTRHLRIKMQPARAAVSCMRSLMRRTLLFRP